MATLLDVVVPLRVIAVMTIVGMDLRAEDFRRVRNYPALVPAVVLGHWILLLLGAGVIVKLLPLTPTVAGGVLLVAFPLPEITVSEDDAELSVPTDDPVNLVGFKTTANGRPVTAQAEQGVLAAGVDRTDYLDALDVPLAPHLRATTVALDRLPKAKWSELINLGLTAISEYDFGKGMEKHLSPRWILRTTFQRSAPAKLPPAEATQSEQPLRLTVPFL